MEHNFKHDTTPGLLHTKLSPFASTTLDSSQALVTDEVQEFGVGPWYQELELPRKEARQKRGRICK